MFFRDQSPAPFNSTQRKAEELPRTYLDVPFAEKDEAKQHGAKWDSTKRMWYAPNNESALLDRWGLEARQLTQLNGEDRTFGEESLYIDFLPKSCWCKKIRYAIDRVDLNRVQDLVFGRVNRTCEMCGVQDLDKPFELHGRWEYDTENGSQKLKRLVAMCSDCFDVTHFGAATFAGRREKAIVHWQKVTGRTSAECKIHIDESYAKANQLNARSWTVDLSLLTSNGIKCAEPKPAGMFSTRNKNKSPPSSAGSGKVPPTVHRGTRSSSYSKPPASTDRPSAPPLARFAFRGS